MERSFGTCINPEAYTHFTNSCAETETFNLGEANLPKKRMLFGYLVHDKEEERYLLPNCGPPWPVLPVMMAPVPAAAFSALLVHFHWSLMEHFGQKQVIVSRHAWEIGSALAAGHRPCPCLWEWFWVHNALLILNWDIHHHVILSHGVFTEPLVEFVIGDFTFQLLQIQSIKNNECLAEKDSNL